MGTKGWPNYYAHDLTGDMCSRQAKPAEALREYEKAESLYPYDYKLLCKKAMVLRTLGRVDEALATVERAMDLYPVSSATRMEYIKALFESGRYEKAFRRMELFLRSRIPNAEHFTLAGQQYAAWYARIPGTPSERRKYLLKAIEYLEKAQQLGMDHEARIQHLRDLLPPDEASSQ
jgi:tetratricopeptide (TPR) repeat protein